MGLMEDLREVIEEVDRVHPDGLYEFRASSEADLLLNFVTSESGYQRHFTKKALMAIGRVATTLHSNDAGISSAMG